MDRLFVPTFRAKSFFLLLPLGDANGSLVVMNSAPAFIDVSEQAQVRKFRALCLLFGQHLGARIENMYRVFLKFGRRRSC